MKRPKLRHLKKIVVIVLVIGFIVLVVIWGKAPGEGTVNGPSITNSPTTYYDKKLNGTYIAFQFSGKYMAKDDGARDNNLERHTLTADTHYDKRIQVTVSNLPDGNLESNGDYNLRMKSPGTYADRKLEVRGALIDIWVKNDGMEQTAIMAHGDKVASISFVTANASDDLTGEMDALLKTFQWKQ